MPGTEEVALMAQRTQRAERESRKPVGLFIVVTSPQRRPSGAVAIELKAHNGVR
jgi:hypothetical protein